MSLGLECHKLEKKTIGSFWLGWGIFYYHYLLLSIITDYSFTPLIFTCFWVCFFCANRCTHRIFREEKTLKVVGNEK